MSPCVQTLSKSLEMPKISVMSGMNFRFGHSCCSLSRIILSVSLAIVSSILTNLCFSGKESFFPPLLGWSPLRTFSTHLKVALGNDHVDDVFYMF